MFTTANSSVKCISHFNLIFHHSWNEAPFAFADWDFKFLFRPIWVDPALPAYLRIDELKVISTSKCIGELSTLTSGGCLQLSNRILSPVSVVQVARTWRQSAMNVFSIWAMVTSIRTTVDLARVLTTHITFLLSSAHPAFWRPQRRYKHSLFPTTSPDWGWDNKPSTYTSFSPLRPWGVVIRRTACSTWSSGHSAAGVTIGASRISKRQEWAAAGRGSDSMKASSGTRDWPWRPEGWSAQMVGYLTL